MNISALGDSRSSGSARGNNWVIWRRNCRRIGEHSRGSSKHVVTILVSTYSLQIKGLTQRELHLLHADIKALQATFGISYKDAAHRLFLTEVERLKKADSATKAFAAVRGRIDDLVMEDIFPPISAIDKGELDDYILNDGKWKRKDDEPGSSGKDYIPSSESE